MILIVSSKTDEHAKAVIECLNDVGSGAVLLDMSLFPQKMDLSMNYNGTEKIKTISPLKETR